MLEKSVKELIEKTESKAFNLKMLLIGGATKKDAELFILCLNPLYPDRKLYKTGARCISYQYERAFPQAKTLNMLQSYLAYREAKRAGAYDALLINSKGCITEGTRTNFFAMKGKKLFSPPAAEILLGVTRKAVLQVALANGYSLEERAIPLRTVASYDGAFITSTSSKIVPIARINQAALNPQDPHLQELIKLFDQFLKTCNGKLD